MTMDKTQTINYGTARDTLVENGYKPIPLSGKRPITPNWTKHKSPDASDYAARNVGITTRFTPALDIDCDDAETVAALAEHVAQHYKGPLCRIGRAPRRVYMFRTDSPYPKTRVTFTRGGERAAVEILCDGQQVAIFGTHPNTKRPYEWITETPLDVSRDDLPYLSKSDAGGLLTALVSLMHGLGWGSVNTSGQSHDGAGLKILDEPVQNDELPNTPLGNALRRVDVDDYDSWVSLGQRLKAAERLGQVDDGFALWVAASSTYPGSSESECAAKWDSFTADRVGGIETLVAAVGVRAVDDFADCETDDQNLIKLSSNTPQIRDNVTQETPKKREKRPLFTALGAGIGEPIRWTVENYLEAEAVGVLYGDAAAYKTFTAIDMALSVCHGKAWLGTHRVEQGSVWIIAGEGLRGMQRRVAAWRKRNEIDHDDLGAGLFISGGSMPLDNPDTLELLLTHGDRNGWPKLIIIDTLSRNFSGDENDTGQVRGVLEHAAKLASVSKATVLILHHSKKEGGQYRGSSTIKANVDFLYSMKKSESLVTILTPEKMKDADDPPEVVLNLKKVLLGMQLDQWGTMQEITSLVPELSQTSVTEAKINDIRHRIIDVLRKHPDGIGSRDIRDLINAGSEKIDEARDFMIDACEVEIITENQRGGRPKKLLRLTEYGKTL